MKRYKIKDKDFLGRKREIELYFEGVLKKAKTFEQVSKFYSGVVRGVILEMLCVKGIYNYNGFTLYITDMEAIILILEEHYLKEEILYKLR